MHDPDTIAFEIRYPWWRTIPSLHKSKNTERHHDPFITIWHHDPQKDGSDDSCGFGYPKLKRKQIEELRNSAWSESRHPHFLCMKSKHWKGLDVQAEILYRGLIALVSRILKLRLSWNEICLMACESIHVSDGCGTPGDVFCYLPGYHTNSKIDTPDERQDHFTRILCGVARNILFRKRPWFLHPRWHIHHWRFQVHPWKQFKRAFIERCCVCDRGFSWGEEVIGNWGGTKIWHQKCDYKLRPVEKP